jgi:hypothetical protein
MGPGATAGTALAQGNIVELGRREIARLGEFTENDIGRLNPYPVLFEVLKHGFEPDARDLPGQLGQSQQLGVRDRPALLGAVSTVLYILVPCQQVGEGSDADNSADKGDDTDNQRRRPFGPQGEGFGDFAHEIAHERFPVEVNVEARGDHEDNAEPVVKPDPLLLRQGQQRPAGPVCNPPGRYDKQHDTGKSHPDK